VPAAGHRGASRVGRGREAIMTADGIVAGYDGSAGSDQALSWAAREARARRVTLTVCHA